MKLVTYSVGEQDYYLRFENGRIERVSGLWRFLCLGGWLILRGYTLRHSESKT